MSDKSEGQHRESNLLFNPDDQIWNELRSLFVGKEKVELDRLQRFLEDPEELTKEIARRLPQAVNLTHMQSRELTKSLVSSLRPVLEEAVINSSKIDPKVLSEGIYPTLPHAINLTREKDEQLTTNLVEAIRPIVELSIQRSAELSIRPLSEGLYPVIGPAIRKAVADAFRKMNQALNQSFDRTLSISAIKWRFESITTGRPFIEIVARNTLLYQVKQVFVIHGETGLLLQSVKSPTASVQDPDMVSSMLKAIQDFVKDSFDTTAEEELSTIEVGNQTIWIEQGPKAILAGVVDGSAPLSLRTVFKSALERFHVEFARDLAGFQGDTATFEADTRLIEFCLQSQLKEEKKKVSFLKWGFIMALVGILGFWGYGRISLYLKWSDYLDYITSQPGIIITDHGRQGGTYFVTGLRTPRSAAPQGFLADFGFHPESVKSTWHLYQPLTDSYILSRAKRLLNPPDTVEMSVKDGTLVLKGQAGRKWLDQAKQTLATVWEVGALDHSELHMLESDLINQLKTEIESYEFNFGSGKTDLSPADNRNLNQLAEKIENLVDLLPQSRQEKFIQINGFTDAVGNPENNRKLSYSRAQTIFRGLVARGVSEKHFRIFGYGSDRPLTLSADRKVVVGRKVVLFVDI